MAKTRSHSRAQSKAAGKRGRTEVPLRTGRILDARTPSTATEVERSGRKGALCQAARRLAQSYARRKVLQVPQRHMPRAGEAMRTENVHGTVKNMSGTKRRSV